jgi:hypothetical protein
VDVANIRGGYPVSIPHDIENRGVAIGIDRELNPHVIGPITPPPPLTEPTRLNLSRWRHGFEPRWDYTEKRRSEALSNLKRRLSSPVRPAFVPRPTPTRRQSQRGRPGRLGRPTRSAVELFESARSRRDSALHERIGTLAKTRLGAVLWAGAGSYSGQPKPKVCGLTACRTNEVDLHVRRSNHVSLDPVHLEREGNPAPPNAGHA